MDLDLLFTDFLSIVCGPEAALECPVRDQHSRNALAETFMQCSVPVVSMMPSVFCGGNPKGRYGGGFLSASKTSSAEEAGWEVLVQFSPRFPLCFISGFCHLRVSPAFLWCLQKKDRSWPENVLLSAMVPVPCPGSQGSQCTLGDTGLPPAVIAASPFRHTPSPWNCHFECSTLVKITCII